MPKYTAIKPAITYFAIACIIALAACDNNTTTTSNDSPIITNPTTSVSGRVTDSTTGEPIHGAVVMIEGLNISASTDADGNYTLLDVPPNTSSSGNFGNYRVTIDMKNVKSPVLMSDTTITNRYADMDVTGNTMAVQASDINGANGTSIGETDINNVVNFNVGKASATVSGVVYGMDGSTLVEGARVELWQGAENVGVTTSAATTGAFNFSEVEAGFNYTLVITKDDMTYTSPAAFAATENLAYSVDVEKRIVLAYSDTLSPSVINNPDPAMDKANDADAVFSWVLNEAIAADPMGYRDSVAVGGSLYDDILVTFDGAKVGGVAKTVAWNTDFTILSVTIAAASLRQTSAYTINMGNVSNTGGTGSDMQLMDAAGNSVADASFATRSFTTNGGTDLSSTAPTLTLAAPKGTLTHNETNVVLDWPAVAGANSYNVYRTATVGGVSMGTVLINNVTTSSDNDALNGGGDDFGSGLGALISAEREAISYAYQVAAVNSNKVEGAMSTATSAIADSQTPLINSAVCTDGASDFEDTNGVPGSELVVNYSEPMNVALAETLAAYTGIVTGAVALEYDIGTNDLTISWASNICAGGTVTVDSTVTDIAGNVLDTTAGDGNGNTHTF